ncbi:MAG: AAA family ATPase [Patescibacteria group bacterium]
MYLERLEIQGFKSFANKVGLEFLSGKTERRGLTAVVGPNGSGKSNIADSIRWVLGEQSIKLLRGKKSEDVIFSGTDKKPRSGMAEVSLFLDNSDHQAALDYDKIVITRRLYRDGESEYLINKNKARLLDIQLMLAQANFGQRTYSVIGQGAIEAFLLMSPAERKDFFDEAAGVKHLEIKRNQAINKLEATTENIKQAETLIAEIEPRLKSLTRQVKRLAERGELESELYGIEHQYYGTLWQNLTRSLKEYTDKLNAASGGLEELRAEVRTLRAKMMNEAKEESSSGKFTELQKESEALQESKNELREKEWRLRSQIEQNKIATIQNITPLPLHEIIKSLKEIDGLLEELSGGAHLGSVIEKINELHKKTAGLLDKLQPKEVKKTPATDPKLEKELEALKMELVALGEKTAKIQEKIRALGANDQKNKLAFFEIQEKLAKKQDELRAKEDALNQIKIELARLETKRDSLEQEMAAELQERLQTVKTSSAEITPAENAENLLPQIQRLRYQLELIGGLDPETMKEYEETKSRFDFLTGTVADLKTAMDDTYKIIEELDLTIKSKFEEAFEKINADFGRYFKMLFSGGRAELIKVAREEEEDEEVADSDLPLPTTRSPSEPACPVGRRGVRRRGGAPEWSGLEIQAVPPGKRVKTIGMLSGGERALTSIALLCAIISNNPSPFVVLDEVDASLDEANSIRFADIIGELAGHTQFIVITHNRYTMEHANILYGVTMGDDGVSHLLSLKLEEAEQYQH